MIHRYGAASDRTRTHGHGHGNGHGKVARDRKVGFAHRVLSAGSIVVVTEGSSQQILKADRQENVKAGPEVFLEHERLDVYRAALDFDALAGKAVLDGCTESCATSSITRMSGTPRDA
jgi:hypothetical protein